MVVPCMAATAAISLFFSPIAIWPVFGAFTALALVIAIWSIVRVSRKSNHPWNDYYKKVTFD